MTNPETAAQTLVDSALEFVKDVVFKAAPAERIAEIDEAIGRGAKLVVQIEVATDEGARIAVSLLEDGGLTTLATAGAMTTLQ